MTFEAPGRDQREERKPSFNFFRESMSHSTSLGSGLSAPGPAEEVPPPPVSGTWRRANVVSATVIGGNSVRRDDPLGTSQRLLQLLLLAFRDHRLVCWLKQAQNNHHTKSRHNYIHAFKSLSSNDGKKPKRAFTIQILFQIIEHYSTILILANRVF